MTQNQKPCLVNTAQGFSVSYQNKFLYSKYAPNKAILQTVSSLNLLPGTLILCHSPLLPYGLLELISRLPDDCILLGVEIDSNLSDFIKSFQPQSELVSTNTPEKIITQNWQELNSTGKFTFLSKDEIYNLPVILNKKSYITEKGFSLPVAGTFRRVLCINCSAGTRLHSDFYSQLEEACTNAIMTFWSNRVTLTKFGHNYSKNFFKNLELLPQTLPIENYFNSVTKSIIVFGAGQSIDKGIAGLKGHEKESFILCADTAFQPLLQNGITPDGVFIEEAQQIITKAFIGTIKSGTHIFAGLSSITTLAHTFPLKDISFFTTLYADASFIHNLQDSNLLPPANNPFGSVGLTAVYYALKFRKNDKVPVFIYGLDFSFTAGITHGKGTPAHINRLLSTNRLTPLQNYASAFSSTKIANDKKGSKTFTTHILSSYANTFNSLFQNEKNLFDSADSGLPLMIPQKKPCYADSWCADSRVKPDYDNTVPNHDNTVPDYATIQNLSFSCPTRESQTTPLSFSCPTRESQTQQFFKNEAAALTELKNILTGKIQLSEEERNKKIMELIEPREYLYLHFPDGYKASTELSFLKRIRAELEIFLKIFR